MQIIPLHRLLPIRHPVPLRSHRKRRFSWPARRWVTDHYRPRPLSAAYFLWRFKRRVWRNWNPEDPRLSFTWVSVPTTFIYIYQNYILNIFQFIYIYFYIFYSVDEWSTSCLSSVPAARSLSSVGSSDSVWSNPKPNLPNQVCLNPRSPQLSYYATCQTSPIQRKKFLLWKMY